MGKRRFDLRDYLMQQLIEKTSSLPAKRLGIAYGPIAFPRAQFSIPIKPTNGDKRKRRAVEFLARLPSLGTIAHNDRKVDDRGAFAAVRIYGYLLLVRFHSKLLSAL